MPLALAAGLLSTPGTSASAAAGVPRSLAIPPPVTDFNGDGYADLAVSALNGDSAFTVDGGSVHVMYGSAAGIQTVDPPSQYWTADSDGMPVNAQTGAQFGFAVSSGDFNGDGYSDLAIGAPRQDIVAEGVSDPGAVYVLYGSSAGLQDVAPAAQYFDGTTPGFPVAPATNGFLGRTLIGGDFDGDGYADLGIGAPRQDVGAAPQAGVAAVLYGSSAGLTTTGSQAWTEDSPGVPDQVEAYDWFARALGAGDYNDDGYADLAVGVPLENEEVGTQTREDSGAVIVIFGSSDGLRSTAPDAQFWDQDSPHIQDRDENNDYFGHNLASADFNGDGYDDLAIGDRLEDLGLHPTRKDAGMVNVIYGSAAGLQADAPPNQVWERNGPGLPGGAASGDQFGFSVTTGDLNGDGYADLAIGIPFADDLSVRDAGAVLVLFGGATGLQAFAPAAEFWTQNSPRVYDRAEAYDAFGFSSSANDFNGDGWLDLAIGVLHEDLDGSTVITDAGAVNLLYGYSAGLQTEDPINQFWTEDSCWEQGSAADVNELGWWMT